MSILISEPSSSWILGEAVKIIYKGREKQLISDCTFKCRLTDKCGITSKPKDSSLELSELDVRWKKTLLIEVLFVACRRREFSKLELAGLLSLEK